MESTPSRMPPFKVTKNARSLAILWIVGAIVLFPLYLYVPHIVNKPSEFQTIRGDELLNLSAQQPNGDLLLQPAHAQGANKVLNIVIIGDGYNDLNAFHEDAKRASRTFIQYEPYKTRASQIAFHIVDNIDSLGCSSIDECKTAVMQEINSAGVPYDQVAVLLNYEASNGSESDGKDFALVGNMDENMPHRFTHEVGGHGIGKLLDEYVVSQNDGNIDNEIHQLGNGSGPPPGDGNCYAGTPPVAEWNNIGDSGGYRKGCFYPNWYASSQGSIMGSSEGPPYPHYFNAVSQCIINARLDKLVGPFQGGAVPPENCPQSPKK
jgi:hypothetical protein